MTPNYLHFEPCKLFLQAGIPVICDKPLVNAQAEAFELRQIAARHDTFCVVTYTYTSYSMVRDARAHIAPAKFARSSSFTRNTCWSGLLKIPPS